MLQDSEIGAITTGGPIGHPSHSKYEKLISLAKEVPQKFAGAETESRSANVLPADLVFSQKSLQEELATARRHPIQTATGPAPAATGGTAGPASRLPIRFVSAVVLGAALICFA